MMDAIAAEPCAYHAMYPNGQCGRWHWRGGTGPRGGRERALRGLLPTRRTRDLLKPLPSALWRGRVRPALDGPSMPDPDGPVCETDPR